MGGMKEKPEGKKLWRGENEAARDKADLFKEADRAR